MKARLVKYGKDSIVMAIVLALVVALVLFVSAVFDLVDSIINGTLIPGRSEVVLVIAAILFGLIATGSIIAGSIMMNNRKKRGDNRPRTSQRELLEVTLGQLTE